MPPAAAVIGAAVIGAGGSILASRSQSKALGKAQKGQEAFQQRTLDFQERVYDRGEPSRDMFDRVLADIDRRLGYRGEKRGRADIGLDSLYTDELRTLEGALERTGNLRSGVAQDVTARAIERAQDRRTTQLGSLAALAGGQGNTSTANAISLFAPAAQAAGNLANLDLARGQNQASLFQTLGNIPAQALASYYGGGSSSLFGAGAGGGGSLPFTRADPADFRIGGY